MLTINEINKLRKLYYEHNFSIARAARLIKCSRGTAYKYINFIDMSDLFYAQQTRKQQLMKFRQA